MEINQLIKPLFFGVLLASICCFMMDWSILHFTFRNMAYPLLLFYFFSTVKRPYNKLAVAYVGIAYLGDILINLGEGYGTKWIMLVFLISYLCLIASTFFLIKPLGFQLKGAVIALLSVLVLGLILFRLHDYLPVQFTSGQPMFFVYTLALLSLVGMAMYYFMLNHSFVSFYLAMTALFNVFTDILLVMQEMMSEFKEFSAVVIFLNYVSYYFAIRYFVTRSSTNLEELA